MADFEWRFADVLDEFSNTKIDDKAPDSTTAAGKAPETQAAPSFQEAAAAATASLGPAAAEDEFARQLQAGMADLLGELDNNPDMQKEFEKLVQELGGQAAAAADQANPLEGLAAASGAAAGIKGRTVSDAGKDAGSSASKARPDDFQEAIKRTMARMQESGDSATAASQSAASEDDLLAQMLKEMEKGGFGGLGGGDGEGNEDFSKMLMGMMEQLTNKEILYEPMKELDDKFPEWMEKNKATANPDDLKRYEEQQRLVKEIVTCFEKKEYRDDNAQDREYIVDRMQRVCCSCFD